MFGISDRASVWFFRPHKLGKSDPLCWDFPTGIFGISDQGCWVYPTAHVWFFRPCHFGFSDSPTLESPTTHLGISDPVWKARPHGRLSWVCPTFPLGKGDRAVWKARPVCWEYPTALFGSSDLFALHSFGCQLVAHCLNVINVLNDINTKKKERIFFMYFSKKRVFSSIIR